MEDTKKNKILIVDDDQFLLDMYLLKFTEKKFKVESVFGGINALIRLKETHDFDVILTDVVMPSMDGFELLEKIKKDKLAEESKVIILSNLGQPADIEKGNKLGADGYIVKSNYTPSEVVAQVIKIMEK